MNRTNFHIKNFGWNYFFIQNDGKVSVGRYHTNGITNSKEERTPFLPINPPTCWEECDRILSEEWRRSV